MSGWPRAGLDPAYAESAVRHFSTQPPALHKRHPDTFQRLPNSMPYLFQAEELECLAMTCQVDTLLEEVAN